MRKLLAILLIAIVACATQEEEKTNLIDKIKDKVEDAKDDIADKAKEIAEKAKEIADDVAKKAKNAADDLAEKAKDLGEDISEKAKEIAEKVSNGAEDIAKKFLKFFEKLTEEVKAAVVWLKENGYWDEIVNVAETIGKAAAVQACKTYLTEAAISCDRLVQFIFDAVIAIVNRIKEEVNKKDTETETEIF
jgi:uncharacterized protein YoxC